MVQAAKHNEHIIMEYLKDNRLNSLSIGVLRTQKSLCREEVN